MHQTPNDQLPKEPTYGLSDDPGAHGRVLGFEELASYRRPPHEAGGGFYQSYGATSGLPRHSQVGAIMREPPGLLPVIVAPEGTPEPSGKSMPLPANVAGTVYVSVSAHTPSDQGVRPEGK